MCKVSRVLHLCHECFSPSFLGPAHPTPAGICTTFKIVGDNIDKEVKLRDMHRDYQT